MFDESRHAFVHFDTAFEQQPGKQRDALLDQCLQRVGNGARVNSQDIVHLHTGGFGNFCERCALYPLANDLEEPRLRVLSVLAIFQSECHTYVRLQFPVLPRPLQDGSQQFVSYGIDCSSPINSAG
ncbi:hypothetical protein D3C77_530630 [compost metagenome]